MNNFSIKDIENLSGIKAHTLRIWEKRYKILIAKRKESKHRFYDNEDLKQVLRITHLYNNGYKISAIANMHKNGLQPYEINIGLDEERLVKILIEATVDLDELVFDATLEKFIAASGLEKCVLKIVYPYFEKIGTLWMNNKALPAHERFASNIILKKIIYEIDKLDSSTAHKKPSIVLFTPVNEHHEIPLLFMHYLFKKNKQPVYYAGKNTGFDVLDKYAALNNAGYLYFHVIVNLLHENINDYVKQLTERYKNHTILMSGKLTQSVFIKAKNLKLLRSLEEMIAFGKGIFPA